MSKEEKTLVQNQLENVMLTKTTTKSSIATKEEEILKSLLEKDVVYSKADKGNSIVILDRNEYLERTNRLINESPYVEIADPFNSLVKTT